MDPTLYKASMGGESDVLKQYDTDQLKVQLTRGNNTVLHIAAQFRQTKCVREILQKCGPSLLCSMNIKGETSLHISAREGHTNIVQALIDYGKTLDIDLESGIGATMEMLRMRNGDGDTALYEAVRNNRLDVVEILTKEDPEFVHPPSGPNGRTTLHVAIMCGARSECIETLLHWNESLIKEGDVHGWRPLHYAAWSGRPSVIDQLLCLDKSVAYLAAEEDGNKTALHIAASRGNIETMKRLLSYCPDCWEMLNSKGQNILHIAVEHEKNKIIKFILKNPMLGSLINQKDHDGNTPIQLHAAKPSNRHYAPLINRAFNFIDPFEVLPGDEDDSTSKAPVCCFRSKLKVYKIKGSQKIENKIKQEFTKLADTALVVAGLIATVTFTAGFTVPGGFESDDGANKGMAVLGRRAAFIAFAVADTIAMLLSIIAVLLLLISSTYTDDRYEHERINRRIWASRLIVAAMAAMVVAFMTGFYATLEPSLGLAITICLICCVYFPISFFVFWKKFIEL